MYQALKKTDEFEALADKDWIQTLTTKFSSNGVVDAEAIIQLEKIGLIADGESKKTQLKELLQTMQQKSIDLAGSNKTPHRPTNNIVNNKVNTKLKILF